MADLTISKARLRGCDATHRASNSDTHLTHGCMAQFRQFSRVRRGCAAKADLQSRAIAALFEGAPRTLGEVAA